MKIEDDVVSVSKAEFDEAVKELLSNERVKLLAELRSSVDAERRQNPWPQFGYIGGEEGRQATRDGFNMAIDIVLDKIDRVALGLIGRMR